MIDETVSMLTVQIEGSENLLGSLNRVKLFTISLGFRKDIVRNIHFVFLYPSQRHNWPPSLEILTRNFPKSRNVQNFEQNIKHDLTRSCFLQENREEQLKTTLYKECAKKSLHKK